jgi:NADPH:quinone reductase-like Zn-dependent oxidoreductase
VLGHAVGTDKDANNPAEGAFQQYTIVLERMASPIPDTMPFEDAAVLPLAVSTAASGLFQADYLGLRHPSANAEPTGETVLVWGGSTSVGSNAIQLAAAAGYEAITTASPRNFSYVRSLGPARVTVVSAPAGSGKTVLPRSWLSQAGLNGRAAWVPAGHGERDPQRFWVSVAGALRQTSAGAGAGARGDRGA